MFGFLFGVMCCAGVYWVVRGGGPWSAEPGSGRSWKMRFLRRFLFERLETTPGQERVITQELERLHEQVHDARDDVQRSRRELAQVFRQPELDPSALDAVLDRQESGLTNLRGQLVAALRAVHEVLDERQRGLLADAIERGMGCRHRRRWA